MTDSFLSAGIDVGTTSTHLTISRISVSNSAPASRVPHLEISRREILHQSPVRFTPLTSDGTIDGAAVIRMLRAEYDAAGICPQDVKSGAAIITGESAMLPNSEQFIQELSDLAGDFVVSIAGAHLEGVLAARGSGAVQASKERGITICNVDIGGGTANMAVVSNGRVLETACLGLAARFMCFDENGNRAGITDLGQTFIDGVAKTSFVEESLKCSDELLELLGNLLAEVTLRAITDANPPQLTQRLLITEPLRFNSAIDEYWFSGGVAELMDGANRDPLLFSDMGVYLARGLVSGLRDRGLSWHVPPTPIRATVLGAGNHSMQLSGSTIAVSAGHLPMRNLPIIRPFVNESCESVDAVGAVRHELQMRNLDWTRQTVAIAFPPLASSNYERLSARVQTLLDVRRMLLSETPLVVLLEQDLAAALGQLLRAEMGDNVVVIDGICFDDGDYIDIGQPIAGHQAVPVVMKTLVFRC